MDPNLQGVLNWLDQVGAKLGQMGTQVFAHLCHQRVVDAAVTMAAWGSFSLALMGAGIWGLKWGRHKATSDDGQQCALCFSIAGIIIGFLFLIMTVNCNLSNILAPEGATIKWLLNQ